MPNTVSEQGQATVEAAFLIPILALVLAILVQPTIILYDRMGMPAPADPSCGGSGRRAQGICGAETGRGAAGGALSRP